MKQRLLYLDSARGLAIFTVVYSHICLFCLPQYESSAVIDFLRSYFLNAFFFISGVVAYKSTEIISVNIGQLLIKKIRQLLLPTIIVGIVYALSHHIEIISFFTNDAKYGYWFTIVLFEMFAIYYIILSIASLFRYRHTQAIILLLIAATFYWMHKTIMIQTSLQNILCLGSLTYYMPFFCFGILYSLYKPLISNVIKIGNGILITLVFSVIIAGYLIPVPLFISNISIIAIVMWLIKSLYRYDNGMSMTSKILRGLEILGRNTLEIYFLHYFILFPLPMAVGEYLSHLSRSQQSLSIPEFLIIGSVVVLICVISIFIARLLKTIPYISMLAFGKTISK